MAIDSHFYDTVPGEGINEIEWAQSASSRGAIYGVSSASELLCTAHPSTPYAVNISPAPSGFWGHGVWDTSDAIETIVFAPPAQGARRFDLVAARRDWTPTGGGPTTLSGVQGSATRAIPSARENTPGEVDDQPAWLVEWLGGQTQPQSLTDLRCFAGSGGVMVNDRLALEYLKAPGAKVNTGLTTWTYAPVGNGVWDWVSPVTSYSPITPPNGYSTEGRVVLERVAEGLNRVTVDISIRREGAGFTLGTGFTGLGPVLPPATRGSAPTKYLPVSFSGGTGGNNVLGMAAVVPETGQILIRGQESFTWTKGALFSVNCAYYI